VDLEIEKSLISSLLSLDITRDEVNQVREIVNEKDFLGSLYRTAFETIMRLHENGEDVNIVSVYNAVGIPASEFLTHIDGRSDVPLWPPFLARQLRQRNLNAEISKLVHEKNYIAAKEKIDEFSMLGQEEDIITINDLFSKEHEDLGLQIRTGFTKLDQKMVIRPTYNITLAGRSGVGKTALGMNMMAGSNVKAGIISLEMGEEAMKERIAVQYTAKHLNDVLNEKLFLSCPAAFTLPGVRKVLDRMVGKYGVKFVLVDYIQLMSDNSRRWQNRAQECSFIVRGLKQLAKEYKVAMVHISSLSQAIDKVRGEDAPPQLQDLKETGEIEFNSVAVMFIHRKKGETDKLTNEFVDARTGEVIVAKYRFGSTFRFDVAWLPKQASYGNLDTQHNGYEGEYGGLSDGD
jgi:replicative DNA helicase